MAGSHPATTSVGRGGPIGRTGGLGVVLGRGSRAARRPARRRAGTWPGWPGRRTAAARRTHRPSARARPGRPRRRAAPPGGPRPGTPGCPARTAPRPSRPAPGPGPAPPAATGRSRPDSTAETAWRDTPAMPASCCCENPRACRASRSRHAARRAGNLAGPSCRTLPPRCGPCACAVPPGGTPESELPWPGWRRRPVGRRPARTSGGSTAVTDQLARRPAAGRSGRRQVITVGRRRQVGLPARRRPGGGDRPGQDEPAAGVRARR